jgi:DNA-binding NarL/FixJ family response regulator
VRVVIAEDSALLREGLVRMLAARGHEVVAAVGDAQELLSAVREHAPDVVLADVRMPPTHTDEGIRAAVLIRAQNAAVTVLVLSQYVEERYAVELLGGDTRGVGYLLKDRVADVGDFVAALERVASGGTALDPDVISQIFARSRRRAAIDRLTPREREVLGLMAEGRSNTAIAAALVVSDGAVEKHVSNIFSKLDLAQDADDHRRVRAVVTWLES